MSAPFNAETQTQTENKLEASKKLPGKFETIANLASSALHSAAYEAIQQPLSSIGQFIDKAKPDYHAAERLQFIAPVKQAQFGSAEWHADQLGAAAGQMVPFLASRYMVKPLFAEGAMLSGTKFLTKASPLRFSVAEAAASGFVAQTVFHPVESNDNFWSQKLVDGTKGAATMATLTATTHGLQFLSETELASKYKVASFFKNPIASGVIAGAPAGVLGAEMESIQHDKKFASLSDITKSVYSMSMIGGTFGAIASGAQAREIQSHDTASHETQSSKVIAAAELAPEPALGAKPEPKIAEQGVLNFGEGFDLTEKLSNPPIERIVTLPEPPAGRENAGELQQLELKFPEPLTPVGKKAYELLLHLEGLPKEENAKIVEDKYPITVKEAQAIHILLDEWIPGAQRLYNQIANRGNLAHSMAYDAWVNSSLSKVKMDLPRFYERALIKTHPDNDPADRNKFIGQYLEKPLGMDSREEVDAFLNAWKRTNPLTRWLDYSGDVHCPALLQMVRWGHLDEIPNDAIKPIAEHYRIYEEPFTAETDVKALIAAAPGWSASPFVPVDVATRLAEMPPGKRLAADAALIATKEELGESETASKDLFVGEKGQAARDAFFKHLDVISELSPRAILKKTKWEDSLPLAVDVLHGDSISPEHKVALLQGLASFKRAPQILASMDVPTFIEAYDRLMTDNPVKDDYSKESRYFDWQARSAIILATVFKKNWSGWLDSQQKLGRDNFDSTTWMHANEPVQFKGLGQFLMQHGKKPITQLEKISDSWKDIKENGKVDDYKEALRIGLLSKYKEINDTAFAAEASRWNVPADKYAGYEKRYLASKDLPSPFPLDEKWSVGGLTGRFIPRDDPRGLFLGDHTNCCQHPGGNGESSAWYGQENPKSGFFVVEDADGEVVAQSWTVVTDDGGLLFDNVEAKGLEKRQGTVQQIYQDAATALKSRFHTVTMGTENSDLNLNSFPDAGYLTQKLPVEFSGYTDAKRQVLLASNETMIPVPFERPMLRGALNLDKFAMSEISKQRFPVDWQALPWEPATRGLVLDHKTDGVLGYALFEPANRYVSDIAVKPGLHPRYGHNLTTSLFRNLRAIGGDWTADARDSTSYRMLQRAAKRGYVKIISDTVDDEPMGTEQMHHVVFNVDRDPGQ